jgi:hypothetical protein
MERLPGKYLKCKISSSYINVKTGNDLSWYGHIFKVNPERTEAFCEIPEDLARAEARLGRYQIVQDAPVIEVKPEVTATGEKVITLGNYYGCGDLENFRRKLIAMERPEIIDYASKIMGMNMETRAYKPKLVDELCQIIETKIAEGAGQPKE